MTHAGPAHELDDPEVSPSPFRTAFGRARSDARLGAGPPTFAPRAERAEFEYRLVKRTGKRRADVADWNTLGREGWELVGITGRHAAFKRPL
jgi:hypothetical protein